MKSSTTIVLVALALLVAALPGAAAGLRLDLKPAATVAGPDVTLGEIAAVTGGGPAETQRLREVTIAAAPLPGTTRRLETRVIKTRLRQHGYDPEALRATWPERVMITTKATIVSGAELVTAGEQALRAEFADAELEVTCSRTPAPLVLPAGSPQLRTEILGLSTSDSRLVKVTAWTDGQPRATQTISYRVRRFVQAVVARRAIPRGTVITADDVRLARCELTGANGDAFTDCSAVVGMRAHRPLRESEAVTRAAVEQRPVVTRGQTVRVLVACGAIRVVATAVACGDAAPGASVRLRNEASGGTFVAQVDDSGQVVVSP